MGQNVRWRSGRDDPALFESEQTVSNLGHERDVVFDDDQARAHLVAQAPDDRCQCFDLALGEGDGPDGWGRVAPWIIGVVAAMAAWYTRARRAAPSRRYSMATRSPGRRS